MGERLIDQLTELLGQAGVLTGDDVRMRKASWLGDEPCAAMAILRPATTDEVAAALRLCFENDQPVIPLGGNTGLVEGTLADSNDVMLSLERMNAVQRIDAVSGTAIVEAGVPLQTIQEQAEQARGAVQPGCCRL